MRKMKKIVAGVLAPLMLLSTGTSVLAEENKVQTAGDIASFYIQGVIDAVAEDYRFGADKEAMYKAVLDYVMQEHPELLEGAIDAATGGLDPYSGYFSQDELIAYVDSIEAAYVGIGVTIQIQSDGVEVVEVNPVGGAYAAGVEPGDLIVSVDGTSVVGMPLSEVTNMVKGEADTVVTLGVLRNGEAKTFSVVRSRIVTESVSYTITEDNIGYIHILEFTSGTPDEVKAALNLFREKGVKDLAIDLRNNPGGTLGGTANTLSLFVPKGKVLSKIEYNNERRSTEIVSTASFTLKPDYDIVILINENSASGAEMFSGAMQNLGYATVVGETSYGKGSMQEFMGLRNPPGFSLGDIKLSVAEFTKPDGGKINGVGITPDVRVKNTYAIFDASTLTPMTISAKYTIGDQHQDVLAIEERLSVLGYFNDTPNDTFDEKTARAVTLFQEQTGLFAYGVMDFTTQNMLNDEMAECEVLVDNQLDKAIALLTAN